MMSFFAQALAAAPESSVNWNVVTALGVLASLAANAAMVFRFASGKANERRIEPTQLAGISAELKGQTVTLNKLDREMGETKTAVGAVKDEIATLRTTQAENTENMFKRINAISLESTETRTRVDGLEKREAHKR